VEVIIRQSKKRDAIYKELCATKAHPSADWLYSRLKKKIPELSLGTVYSNLAAFKQSCTAISVGMVDGKERFDGNTSPHAHFICRKCNDVIDLWDIPLPEYPKLSGQVESCQLNFLGLCEKCKPD